MHLSLYSLSRAAVELVERPHQPLERKERAEVSSKHHSTSTTASFHPVTIFPRELVVVVVAVLVFRLLFYPKFQCNIQRWATLSLPIGPI
jgi:hypothetical protein